MRLPSSSAVRVALWSLWSLLAFAAAAGSVASAGAAATAPVPQWEAYEGAHHGFDGAAPVRLRRDVPGGVNPGRGVHLGANPEARAAARLRLERFLRESWSLAR